MRIFGFLMVACLAIALGCAAANGTYLGANGVIWLIAGLLAFGLDWVGIEAKVEEHYHRHHHHD